MVLSSLAGAQSHRITNTADGALALVIPWTLTPGATTTPSSVAAQFRLRSNRPTASGGYRVDAVATWSVTTTAPVSGGATIAASDIGIGITSIVPAPGVDMPRADVIAAGFNYNPGTVVGTNGLTPYTGIGGGQARISDILASRRILNGNRIHPSIAAPNPNNYLQVTLTFGAVAQHWTPATFTSVITLTISNGP
jgi:hypothetical protein